MHLDSAVRDCRVFVKHWSSAAHSLGYLLQYSKKLSTSTSNLLQAVQQAWSLHNTYRPPDALLKQLQRYAWLPSMCEAAMSLKDCCSRQQYAASDARQHSDAMEHADTAILALGSLLLAVLRWCNLSQLMHTAQQQGAPKGAAAFRGLFEQVWCHAGVFLLANYTAVLVALLRQEVEAQQQQQQQPDGKHSAKPQRQGRNSPGVSAARQSPHLQKLEQQKRLGEHIRHLSLNELPQQAAAQQLQEQRSQSAVVPESSTPPSPEQQQQKQLGRPPITSPSKPGRQNSTPTHPEQQQELPVVQLSMASVWRNVQLPAAHRVWGPPSDLAMWHMQGYGVTHSAAAELQLLLMLWGWAIRMAPTLGLQHHASADVVLLLLEAAWLLDVCPAAASHQKRGLCLWNTPVLMLRLLAQPVLPAEDEQDESDEPAAADAAAEAELAAKQGTEDNSRPSKGTATEPRECSRKVLHQMQLFHEVVKKCLDMWTEHDIRLELCSAIADRQAAQGADAPFMLRDEITNWIPRRKAATAQLLQTDVFDCMLPTVQLLETAATASQPFTVAELQLLEGQLAMCAVGAAKGEAYDVHVPEQALQKMQATLGALHQRLGQQKADVLRILQHPGMAGSLVQLPLQLLQQLQPLTGAQLKQAAVQFSRLDDTIRKLVELPTTLLQAEQGLQAELLQAQQLHRQQEQHPQEQQQQQPRREGVWYQYTWQLLQLAEAYIRCQHLSRVVGLETGQLLAAVIPKSAQQLLHVLRSRRLTAGLAALVITRCKALQMLLAETLEQQQVADSAAADGGAAAAGSNREEFMAHWQQINVERQQQQARKSAQDSSDGSGSESSSGSAGLQSDKRKTAYDSDSDDDVDSSSGGEDSVSISSWCSSSSSILDSPGVLLHEKHLAVGSMAVHILEQAVNWLQIIAVWQAYPSAQKAACQLPADAIAQLLDGAVTHAPGDWRTKSLCIASEATQFASLMATSSTSSSGSSSSSSDNAGTPSSAKATEQTTPAPDASGACAPAAGAESSTGPAASAVATVCSTSFVSATVAGAVTACSAPAGSGAAMMDALASTILPMACCMIQSAARALQLLLPVWQQIAPATGTSSAAAATQDAQANGSRHGSSDTDSSSDSDLGSEDEAFPSLKDIASWHQVLATQSLMPAAVGVLAVLPSITAVLQQLNWQQPLEQQQFSGVGASHEAFANAVDTLMSAVGHEGTASCAAVDSSGIPMAAALASEQATGGKLADTDRLACLSMLCLLPFAYREVLQASTVVVATGAATGPLASAVAGHTAVGSSAAAGSSHYRANSPSISSCAGVMQAALDDACDDSKGSAGRAAAHAAAVHRSVSSYGSGVSSPPPSSRLQQPSPHSNSSSGSRYWGCNNAQCVNLSSASELTMPVYGCSACRSAGYACTYCSVACQQNNWPVHKTVCKARRLMAGSK